ncbi:glycosyltransferase family 2 protein [Lactococcus insecticola]|uniref:Glycosyl transferase family 2 n=1 Tax=Pseudolactococcus insecticola TaxID=2709158 RepID=A0A6A0B383_9LACT|nr:glycosyltransferase family A protein [Lactococcus insecticola]GFH39799.1 glycosyl transferase family 2 [Lactococcus insecticola]
MEKNIKNQEYQEFQYDLTDKSWQEKTMTFKISQSKIITQTPKVSVVIANYNNAPYLSKMMDSLVNQTLGIENLQVMFIDDKSTDNSIEVVKPYIDKYPNIEIYQLDENTGGAHGPRNVGLLNARGEYLVILDADDWYDENALAYLSQLMDESGDDFAVSGIVQSIDGKLSLKSRPYFIDGEFRNRSIQELSAEFYGWLGPQGIMIRRELVTTHNLHFVNQRVADDVTFFYEALQFSQTITQGKEMTTYLNRDADNLSLSKAINRNFMISWFRALSYINETFPDDTSKERFLSRRLEWLLYDFCVRRDIGYKFGKARIQDFKAQLDQYIGKLNFDPSKYFRSDLRKLTWQYLNEKDAASVYRFINLHSVRYVLNKKLGLVTREGDTFYFPQLSKKFPKVRLNAHAVAKNFTDHQLDLEVYSYKPLVGFEIRSIMDPYASRIRLSYHQLSENQFQVTLPQDYDDKKTIFVAVFDDYSEVGVKDFRKIITKHSAK